MRALNSQGMTPETKTKEYYDQLKNSTLETRMGSKHQGSFWQEQSARLMRENRRLKEQQLDREREVKSMRAQLDEER